MDDTKAIRAAEIIKERRNIIHFDKPFILVQDSSANLSFSNLIDAINILAADGWEISHMNYAGTTALALCKNPRYKAKTMPKLNDDQGIEDEEIS